VEVIGRCRAVSAIVNWLAGCRVTLSPFVDNSDLASGRHLPGAVFGASTVFVRAFGADAAGVDAGFFAAVFFSPESRHVFSLRLRKAGSSELTARSRATSLPLFHGSRPAVRAGSWIWPAGKPQPFLRAATDHRSRKRFLITMAFGTSNVPAG
jgi:hypothetical protein